MSRRLILALVLGVVVILTTASIAATPATPDATPQQQIAQLKKQLRNAKLNSADLQDEVDALNAVNGDQADTITRLRVRLANQPDPLDSILTRDPDGQWAAMVALWRAFPTLAPGALCGYDKSGVPGGGVGLTLTSFTFYRWQGC